MEGIVLALFVCLILALITKRLSLPSIPFYIIAGLLLGESGLKLVGADEVSLFLTHPTGTVLKIWLFAIWGQISLMTRSFLWGCSPPYPHIRCTPPPTKDTPAAVQ